LVARAFGASYFILSDVRDEEVRATVERIVTRWGGNLSFEMGKPWKQAVSNWRSEGGTVVHLTVYGENIETSDVMERIKAARKNVLVLVGSQKVPRAFFSSEVSDFNVAVGNQPHSEVSSLAVFLDRLFEGKELGVEFDRKKLKIIPQKHGKKVTKS
jgi:tRNA (cytidine56-2'-O)-methyltransferase